MNVLGCYVPSADSVDSDYWRALQNFVVELANILVVSVDVDTELCSADNYPSLPDHPYWPL